MEKKQKNYDKGITLIALVITIIAVLIIAGVTLSIVFNEGIINKSQTAVDKYSEESAREKLSVALLLYKMGIITGEAGEGKKELSDYLEEINATLFHNETERTYTIKIDGYNFKIDDSKYEIISNEVISGETEPPIVPENPIIPGETEPPIVPEDPIIPGETEQPEGTKYIIIYNSNGGTGDMEYGEKTKGVTYKIAKNEFIAQTGYSFKEWNTQEDGNGTKYTENQNYVLEEDLTLYAIWHKNEYNIGDTVSIGEEQFYVLNETYNTLTLFAKYNLGKSKVNEKWKQLPNADYSQTGCAFSSTDYWKNDFKGEDLDLHNLEKESEGDAIAKAKEYAKTVTGDSSNNTGRLLTNKEKEDLWDQSYWNGNIAKMLWGQENTQSNGKYLLYWIGTACDSDYVWYVDGGFGGSLSDLYSSKEYNGVRPVITVSKSMIQ